MSEEIKQLENEEFELLQRLNANRYKQRELKTQKRLKELGWVIGCDIKFTRKDQLITMKLTGFEYLGTEVKHPIGLKYNNSGDLGHQRIIIWPDEIKWAVKI